MVGEVFSFCSLFLHDAFLPFFFLLHGVVLNCPDAYTAVLVLQCPACSSAALLLEANSLLRGGTLTKTRPLAAVVLLVTKWTGSW